MRTFRLYKTKLNFREGSNSIVESFSFTNDYIDVQVAEIENLENGTFRIDGTGDESFVMPRFHSRKFAVRYNSKASLGAVIPEIAPMYYSVGYGDQGVDSDLLSNTLNAYGRGGNFNMTEDDSHVWMSKTLGGFSYPYAARSKSIYAVSKYGKVFSIDYYSVSDTEFAWQTDGAQASTTGSGILKPVGFSAVDPLTLVDGWYVSSESFMCEMCISGTYSIYSSAPCWGDGLYVYQTVWLSSIERENEEGIYTARYPTEGSINGSFIMWLMEPDFAPEDYAEQGNIYWNGVWHKDMYLNGHYHSSAYVRENGSWSKWWQHL